MQPVFLNDPRAGEGTGAGQPHVQRWVQLVEKIRDNDPGGMEELYGVLSKGIRYLLLRRFGPQDLDDKVHDDFMVIAQAIRRGDLREPERLMGYVRTVVSRQVAGHIKDAVYTRRNKMELDQPIAGQGADPEQLAIEREHADIAMRILGGVSRRHREILVRFYLEEQTQDQICREMGLTATQFRLIKSRAKARYRELGKRRVARPAKPDGRGGPDLLSQREAAAGRPVS